MIQPALEWSDLIGLPGATEIIADIWQAACGEALTLSPRAVVYNLRPSTGVHQTGTVLQVEGVAAGFALASIKQDDPAVIPPTVGWCDAIAVRPEYQQRGLGSALLTWVEQWLADQGAAHVLVGGSLRLFVPGAPAGTGSEPFFRRRGYEPRGGPVWDVGANLAGYTTPPDVPEIAGSVRPLQAGETDALLTFLCREFPGRWRYEFEEFQRERGRLSDFMVLWTARGIDGFCRLTFEDSVRPVERFYPAPLPRPWGQLGPIGIAADARGKGYGLAVLDAGLRRLHNNGINGCIIDWTELTGFYGKFGFVKHRQYTQLIKALAG